MSDHVLERRLWLPRARPQVFDWLADPANLPRLVPAGARFAWLAPPPARLVTFARLDFRLRLLGLPTRWRVLVRELDPPHRIVTVQVCGPFARWEHRRRLLEGPAPGGQGAPGTWIEDRLTYRPGWGSVGAVAHRLIGGHLATGAFAHREARLRAALG